MVIKFKTYKHLIITIMVILIILFILFILWLLDKGVLNKFIKNVSDIIHEKIINQ